MRKHEWGRYTPSQLMFALTERDPNGPPPGTVEVDSIEEALALAEEGPFDVDAFLSTL